MPVGYPLAKVRRTMIGLAGAGTARGAIENRIVVIEFDARVLREAGDWETFAHVSVGGEEREATVLQYNAETDAYRVTFELGPDTPDPTDLKCRLSRAGRTVSEIWTFRWAS